MHPISHCSYFTRDDSFYPKCQEEGRFSYKSPWSSFIRPLDKWQLNWPRSFGFLWLSLENLLNYLIGSFYLLIGLRMSRRRVTILYVKFSTKLTKIVIAKLLLDYKMRYTILIYDILLNKISSSLLISNCQRLNLHPLCEVINGNYNKLYVLFSF